jgi:hypothetical protein
LPFEPLRPYFAQAECWRGLALRGDGKAVAGALDDGRVFAWVARHEPALAPAHHAARRRRAPLPRHAGSVAGLGDRFLVATGDTYTPWILRAEDVRPPQPHPTAARSSASTSRSTAVAPRLENDVEASPLRATDRSPPCRSRASVNPAPGDVNGVTCSTSRDGQRCRPVSVHLLFAAPVPTTPWR